MFKFGRVLLPAGAFGYYTVKRKVDDISSSLPDFRDYIPEIDLQNWTDSISETSRTLNEWLDEANQAIKSNTHVVLYLGLPEEPKDWDISKKQLATAILDNETQQKQLEAQHDQVKKSITQVISAKLKSVGSSTNDKTSLNNKETIEISVDELEHLKKLEIEYIGLRKRLERLEKEKRGYEAQLRGSGGPGGSTGSSKGKRKLNSQRSLIDLYSEVLDELSGYDSSYRMADHLPKVVVVGDQSSGKTSVLEMIAGARIFPRGAGEMMTRAPVQVTLSEGPYHIARFNDSSREYDLTKEPELADLRREIEERMRRSVQGGKTVSNQVISLSIQGPGIQRMVLVDLPGIIGTVTTELAPDTKECIKKMVTEYMGNPNAIILCIQDGSLDAERSIFTDLVREVDEKGRRTILVLTKVDIAEETHKNPGKIKKILDGELFPMKALGYYAVVAGKSGRNEDIQEIRDYEENFFRTSALRRNGILNPGQCTISKLSAKVSECFWDMVRASIGEQAVAYKATLYNLEAEWDQLFPHKRQLTRDELFEDARYEILNEVAEFTRLSEKHWTQIITSQLWQQINDHIMQRIYFPASRDRKQPSPTVDFELNRWIDSLELPNLGIKIAQQSLKYQFDNMLESKPPFDQKSKARQSWSSGKRGDNSTGSADDDPTIYKELKRAVIYDALERHQWNSQALNALKSTQKQAVSKQTKLTEENWRNSIEFLSTKLTDLMKETANELTNLLGLSFVQRWMQWSYISPDQRLNQMIQLELEKALTTPDPESLRYAELGDQELDQIKRNLVSQGIDVDPETIRKLWIPFHRHHFLINEIARAKLCKSLYSYYENEDNSSGIDCHHVELFGRIKRLVESTVETLRYQIMADECKRMEKQISKVLDEYRDDETKKAELLNGKRVELAQELKRVRHIQEKLEEFEQELSRESKG